MMALFDWFASSVRRHAAETALDLGPRVVTYRELDELVDGVAAAIVAARGAAPPRVGLLASRSVVAYAGYLAVLKLGSTVVPLNPEFPWERNLALCTGAAVDVVIADESGSRHCPDLRTSASLHVVEVDPDTVRSAPCSAPVHRARAPEEVAYVLFTSGSTGAPKGVPVLHRNVDAYLARQIERYQPGPGCRFSQNFDLTFDPSVFDMFVAFGSGATLVVPSKSELLSPVAHVNQRNVTHWFSVPSVISMAHRLGVLTPNSMPSLRNCLFIGEQLTLRQAEMWGAAAPFSTVDNLYGPTELTVSCSAYRLPRDRRSWPTTPNGTVPIGDVEPGLDTVILGEDGAPALVGELCVRGDQRFPGYLDPRDDTGRFLRPDERQRMLPHGVERAGDGVRPVEDHDWYRTGDQVDATGGHLVHLGRLDDQIKLRGYRVEPGEIETVMRQDHRILDAVVVAVPGEDGETDLVAAYTGGPAPDGELVALVRRTLPAYMVPGRYVHLPRLPLTRNGKLDRRRVAEILSGGERSAV